MESCDALEILARGDGVQTLGHCRKGANPFWVVPCRSQAPLSRFHHQVVIHLKTSSFPCFAIILSNLNNALLIFECLLVVGHK